MLTSEAQPHHHVAAEKSLPKENRNAHCLTCKVPHIADQPAGHSTGRCSRPRSPFGQAESHRHNQGDSVDGLAPATRGAFDDAEDGCFTSAGRGHSARPSPGPRRVAAHLFTLPEQSSTNRLPPIRMNVRCPGNSRQTDFETLQPLFALFAY